ncbi:MAG TPA: ATPase, T2SS/T4P/T4SS family, partial [Acidimicrobiales bacterium]|nr:ATPase, T2SS/T4P/T4SS family [Acidimicrobiales bacterium]
MAREETVAGDRLDNGLARFDAWIASFPEATRPRVLTAAEDPDPAVLDLLADADDALALRRLTAADGSARVEVLFRQVPDRTTMARVVDQLRERVAVALVHPGAGWVWDEMQQRARAMRGASGRYLDHLLARAFDLGASDLRIGIGDHPLVKLSGTGWRRLVEFPQVTPEQAAEVAEWAAGRPVAGTAGPLDIDASATHQGRRLRANVYRERGQLATSLRVIPDRPVPFEALGLPPVVATFASLRRGLVLVTGPTGSGKTTTLYAALSEIKNDE